MPENIPKPIATPSLSSRRALPKSASTTEIFRSSYDYRRSRTPTTEQAHEARRRESLDVHELQRHGYPASTKPPLIHRLMQGAFSVSNPPSNELGLHTNGSNLNLLDSSTSIRSVDLDEQSRRFSVLNALRPQRLIGTFKSRAKWSESYYHNVESITNKKLRKYYEEQNCLIQRFEEIDKFLDSGMHINMLTNYGSIKDPSRHYNTDFALPGDPDDSDDEFRTESPSRSSDMAQNLSSNTMNSKASRHNEEPANFEEAARYLGYNEEEDNHGVVVAILLNFFVNTLLLVGKIIVTILTNSMSVIASLVDSILDFLSTFIIYVANRLSTTKNLQTQHAYPIGRSRLEPLGVLIFSIIIIISFFQVGQEAFKRLFFNDGPRSAVSIGLNSIIIMGITIVSKLACFIWCSASSSSSVQALAQDAKTDVVFNIVSLLMPVAGHWLDIWWLDPLGALLLSVYIIYEWGKTAFEHIDNLTGAVANEVDYKVVLYLSYRFAESIDKITALKVYHVGDNLNVEIDLVFNLEDFQLTLKDCHDIAEALQYAIETLPMVERAFVHIDYMEGNFKGHLK